jgi:hypothetical protein
MTESSGKVLLDYDYMYYPTNYESGILRSYPVSQVSACSICLDTTYSQATTSAVINACTGPFLFVGALYSGFSYFELGAWGPVSEVQTKTVLNTPHLYNGVYWYFTSSKSFGFSLNPSISQSSCDTQSTDPYYRLCWHLDGSSGGYRAGNVLSLNSDTSYSKVIYNCPAGSTYSTGDTTSSSYTRGVATAAPSLAPSPTPSAHPTSPSGQPTNQPSSEPSTQPSTTPSSQPTMQPSAQPSTQVRIRFRVRVRIRGRIRERDSRGSSLAY